MKILIIIVEPDGVCPCRSVSLSGAGDR